MKFARRYDSVRKNLTQTKRRSSRGQLSPKQLLDVLEPRVLMSTTGSTVAGAWGGTLYEVAANQYIVQANAATAAALESTLNAQGLHVTKTYKLADNMFVTTDETDSIGDIEKWTLTHVSTTKSLVLPVATSGPSTTMGPNISTPAVNIVCLQPNFVSHTAGTLPDELNPAVAADPNFTSFVIQNEMKQIGLAPANWQAGQPFNGTNAWDLTTGRSDVIIAVMDTGISTANSADTSGFIWNNPGEIAANNIDDDGNGVIDDIHGADFSNVATDGTAVVTPDGNIEDSNGHGSIVSSIIGGTPFNLATDTTPTQGTVTLPDGTSTSPDKDGAVGVAWHVTILPVVVFTGNNDQATDAAIIAGLDYIRSLSLRGTPITAVNMSFARHILGPASGVGDPGNIPGTNNNGVITPGGDAPAASVFTEMKTVTDRGIIIVAAAGNGNGTTEVVGATAITPSGAGDNIDVAPSIPGSASRTNSMVVTVTGSNSLDQFEPTSNYGPQTCTIAAPANALLATNDRGTTGLATGTSYAAGLVSGAIALIKSLHPNLTGQQIVSLLYQGADKIPGLTPYVQQGRRLNILNSLELSVGNPKPLGSLDVITPGGMAGWIFDQNLGAAQQADITTSLQKGAIVVDGQQVFVTDESNGITDSTFNVNNDRPDLFNAVGSTQHGFKIDFNQFLSPGLHTIQVYALDATIDPATGKLATNPDGSLKYTPVLMFTKKLNGNLPPTGKVEVHTANQISGYATDPNQLGTGEYIQVQINVDGQQAAIVDANLNRTDAVGNHGFSYDPALAPGAHKVDVYALDNFDQTPVLLGSFTVFGFGNPPEGVATFDKVNHTVNGYVIDPDSGFDPLSIQMVVDGINGSRLHFDAIANQPDANGDQKVAVSQPHNLNHGFSITIPNLTPGNHQIKFYAYDKETGAQVDFLTQTIPVDQPCVGILDTPVDPTQITGYVYDPDSVNTPVLFRLDFDNNVGKLQTANLSRGSEPYQHFPRVFRRGAATSRW